VRIQVMSQLTSHSLQIASHAGQVQIIFAIKSSDKSFCTVIFDVSWGIINDNYILMIIYYSYKLHGASMNIQVEMLIFTRYFWCWLGLVTSHFLQVKNEVKCSSPIYMSTPQVLNLIKKSNHAIRESLYCMPRIHTLVHPFNSYFLCKHSHIYVQWKD
jgi:RsiW-degrading membrane proteinase PrsW (M82 family)